MKILAQSFSVGDYHVNGPEGFKFASASIGDVVGGALTYVFAFAGIGLLLMIIRSGYTLMLSAGDAKKLALGRTSLTNAIVGFVIIFAAFWIVQIAGVMFGWHSIGLIFGQ